jgi:hypothetical protein
MQEQIAPVEAAPRPHVGKQQVRERAADIDANDPPHARCDLSGSTNSPVISIQTIAAAVQGVASPYAADMPSA